MGNALKMLILATFILGSLSLISCENPGQSNECEEKIKKELEISKFCFYELIYIKRTLLLVNDEKNFKLSYDSLNKAGQEFMNKAIKYQPEILKKIMKLIDDEIDLKNLMILRRDNQRAVELWVYPTLTR